MQSPNRAKAQGQIGSDPDFDKFVTELEQQCVAEEGKHRKLINHQSICLPSR